MADLKAFTSFALLQDEAVIKMRRRRR